MNLLSSQKSLRILVSFGSIGILHIIGFSSALPVELHVFFDHYFFASVIFLFTAYMSITVGFVAVTAFAMKVIVFFGYRFSSFNYARRSIKRRPKGSLRNAKIGVLYRAIKKQRIDRKIASFFDLSQFIVARRFYLNLKRIKIQLLRQLRRQRGGLLYKIFGDMDFIKIAILFRYNSRNISFGVKRALHKNENFIQFFSYTCGIIIFSILYLGNLSVEYFVFAIYGIVFLIIVSLGILNVEVFGGKFLTRPFSDFLDVKSTVSVAGVMLPLFFVIAFVSGFLRFEHILKSQSAQITSEKISCEGVVIGTNSSGMIVYCNEKYQFISYEDSPIVAIEAQQ